MDTNIAPHLANIEAEVQIVQAVIAAMEVELAKNKALVETVNGALAAIKAV
jgi:hypothetical protein